MRRLLSLLLSLLQPLQPRTCTAVAGAVLAVMALLPEARAADVDHGSGLYRTHCAACHGSNGRPVLPTAPDLSRPTALLKPDPMLLASIRAGRGAMPGYQGTLRDRDILDIVAYLRTFR